MTLVCQSMPPASRGDDFYIGGGGDMMGGTQSLQRPEPTVLVACPFSWTIQGFVMVCLHTDPEQTYNMHGSRPCPRNSDLAHEFPDLAHEFPTLPTNFRRDSFTWAS